MSVENHLDIVTARAHDDARLAVHDHATANLCRDAVVFEDVFKCHQAPSFSAALASSFTLAITSAISNSRVLTPTSDAIRKTALSHRSLRTILPSDRRS